MAGLPVMRAMVKVGPPFSCSGPSSGSTPRKSPDAVNPLQPDFFPSRLCPPELTVPEQFGPLPALLRARIALVRVAEPPANSMRIDHHPQHPR